MAEDGGPATTPVSAPSAAADAAAAELPEFLTHSSSHDADELCHSGGGEPCDYWVRGAIISVAALRGWTQKDQQHTLEKLHAVGAVSLPQLREYLSSQTLNKALREQGLRSFHKRTLVCLHSVVALLQTRASLLQLGPSMSLNGALLPRPVSPAAAGFSEPTWSLISDMSSDQAMLSTMGADALPGHICGLLFSFLPAKGLRKALCCCRRWQQMVRTEFCDELYNHSLGLVHQRRISMSHGHSAVIANGAVYAIGSGNPQQGKPVFMHESARVRCGTGYTTQGVACGDGFGAWATDDGLLFAYQPSADAADAPRARLASAALGAGLPLEERVAVMHSGGSRVAIITVSGRLCLLSREWLIAAAHSPAAADGPATLPIIQQQMSGAGAEAWVQWAEMGPGAGRLVAVACSPTHCAVTDEHGVCYTFGSNDFGQLGHGDFAPARVPSPVAVLKDAGEFVVGVAAAAFFTLAVTRSGRVYAWGGGRQVGGPDPSTELEDFSVAALGLGKDGGDTGQGASLRPSLVPGLDGRRVIQCDAGASHSACVCADGGLFTFGLGELGHGLGRADEDYFQLQAEPREVRPFVDATAVACSGDATAVLCRDGSLRTFGLDQTGMLGHPLDQNPCPRFPGHARVPQPRVVTGVPQHTADCGKYGDARR